MNPFKYAEMMKYLTRAKKANPNLPDVFPASKAPIPAKTQNVEDMEAVNQFMLRNPRKDMANGGSLKFYPKASGGETKQQIAPGVDLKTRDINYGGTLGYEGDKVYGGVEYNTGKVKFDITDEGGTTLFKDTLSKDDAVNFIVGLGDRKGDKFQIKTDKDFTNMQVTFRKSFADGGMLVQPSADGSRPGYADDNVNLYEKYGKKEIDKATKQWIAKSNKEPNRVNKIEGTTFDSLKSNDRNNFKRKYLSDIEKYGEWNPNRKVDSRQKRVLKEQAIQIKLLEETNKKKFFNPKAFAKKNNISLKEVKRNAALLQKNIYNKRMLLAGKEMRGTLTWIPDDPIFSDNALNKLWKSKLIKYEREKIDELFYDAFGREFKKGTRERNTSYNSKKFLAIKKNLNEYRQLRDAINAKYPNINFELDHPLSKSSLNKLFNATN
jgi:hypothetical protein